MSSSHFQLILNALDEYAKETGTDLTNNPFSNTLQGCNSPDEILELIRDKAKAFKEFREGNRKLIKWLNPVVNVVHAFAGALGEGIGAYPPAAAAKAIFAGIDVLIVTASKVSAGYDALVDLFDCIGSFLKRLNIYTGIPPTPAMTDVIVKIMVEILSVLALATKNIKQGRIVTFAKKLLGESEIQAVLLRLDRLTQEEARVTVAQTLEVVHGLMNTVKVVMDDGKASTENIRQALITLQGMSNEINRMRRDQLQEKIRLWLSPPDPSTNHNISCEALHAGTAAWFLQGKIFAEWRKNGCLMWIHGKLGSGKSVLLSAIVEDVEDLRAAGLACVAYYYFDFRDSGKQNRRGLLSSLLEQLCAQSSACYDILSRLYSSHAAGTRKPTDARLAQCLKDVLESPEQPTTYLIVDALDECPNFSGMPTPREKVLESLADLVALRLPNLRICVTSRPEVDIRTVLQTLTSAQVSLHDESGQQKDLLDYIRSVVRSDRKMRRWRDWETQLVVDTLSRKADGMFRWVVCQLEILRRRIPASIRSALDEMPSSLDATYEHLLLGIDEEKREYAHRVFQCLAVSVRPLTVQELAEVLAVRFDAGESPNFNAGWRSEDAEEVLHTACTSLVSVVNVGGRRIVQFSHFSVKEYLTSSRLATLGNDLSRYHILPAAAHTILAQICLSFLLKLDDHVDKNFIQDHPLALYAAPHWVDHAQFEDVSSRIQDAMERLFDPEKPHFSVWIWMYDIDHHWGEHMSTEHPMRPKAGPLYYAALCGFYHLAEHLILTRSSDVDARGGYYITPLHAALGKGYLGVTQLLLRQGANADVRDNDGSSPLLRAARGGKPDIVRLLLEHGADVHFQTGKLETPLHAASSEGEVEICRLLLDRAADLNRQDTQGWTPLHLASRFGHHAVVELLLDRGAGANLQKEDLWTPLHLAAANEKLEVVMLLIQRGADVEIRTESRETALDRAVRAGSLEIVSLLIKHGANLDSGSNNKGHTLLHTAALNGSTEIARLLLDAGLDVDAPSKNSKTPLALASGNGRLEVVRLLIERGADPNSRDNQNWTPLHSASRHGHHDLVRLFLDLHIDANVRKEDGWTPLHLASANGALEVARVLAQGGADVNARSDKQETPLDRAVRTGNLDITRLLIGCGAVVHCRDSKGWTPLHIAARNGHVDLIRLLLNSGAEVDARCEDQKTPLALATSNGMLEAARVLIERRADINSRNSMSWAPLHLASRHGHLNLVQLFLTSGANVDIRKEDLWTSLHIASANGHSEVARLLAERGADVNARTNKRETPLDRAARGGKLDAVRLLIDLGANVNAHDIKGGTPLHAASRHGHLDVIALLLQRGANLNSRDKNNRTPADQAVENGKAEVASFLAEFKGDANAVRLTTLDAVSQNTLGASEEDDKSPDDKDKAALHTAAEEGNLEVVRSLLGRGLLDVNSRDSGHHKTALDIASTTGNLEIARLLIGNGAEVDCRNKTGWTPLHRASRYGHLDVVRLLLDHGADVNAKKQDHWTPLHLSSRNGHLETVRLLLERGADVHARNDEGRTSSQAASGKGFKTVVQLLSEHAAGNA